MTSLLIILKLFVGLMLLFILGYIAGHLLKLNKYYEDIHKCNNDVIKRCSNDDDQNDTSLNDN